MFVTCQGLRGQTEVPHGITSAKEIRGGTKVIVKGATIRSCSYCHERCGMYDVFARVVGARLALHSDQC